MKPILPLRERFFFSSYVFFARVERYWFMSSVLLHNVGGEGGIWSLIEVQWVLATSANDGLPDHKGQFCFSFIFKVMKRGESIEFAGSIYSPGVQTK